VDYLLQLDGNKVVSGPDAAAKPTSKSRGTDIQSWSTTHR
jgi:hypothetical protein